MILSMCNSIFFVLTFLFGKETRKSWVCEGKFLFFLRSATSIHEVVTKDSNYKVFLFAVISLVLELKINHDGKN